MLRMNVLLLAPCINSVALHLMAMWGDCDRPDMSVVLGKPPPFTTRYDSVNWVIDAIGWQVGYLDNMNPKKARLLSPGDGIVRWRWEGLDEDAKPCDDPWVRDYFPLKDLGINSGYCRNWLFRHGYPLPKEAPAEPGQLELF